MARKTGGGSWTVETVDSLPDVGTWTDIAVDGPGGIHVSYINENTKAVRHAARLRGIWSTEVVPNPNYAAGWGTSIPLDSLGDSTIAYYDTVAGKLRFETKKAGNWTVLNVDETPDRRWRPALVFDGKDVPHLACLEEPGQEIWYATVATVGVAAGAAAVSVYDAAGRLVRTLPADGLLSGSLQWDGRNGRGERASPGVCFIRAGRGEETATAKVHLLR